MSIMLNCFTGWRKKRAPNNDFQFQSEYHHNFVARDSIEELSRAFERVEDLLDPAKYDLIRVAKDYFRGLSGVSDFPVRPDDWIDTLRIPKEMFVVPRLKILDNWIKRYKLLEGFLSFLLRLLYHRTHPADNRIQNLEKELRYLLTILGDISWMLAHSDQLEPQFHGLLVEFEAVANRAGGYVHFLLYSPRRLFKEMDNEIAAVLNQIDLLKANLQSSDISIPPHIAAKTSRVNSLLIINSLVEHLEDLLKQEDDPISDLKFQINHLHLGLSLFTSSINDMRMRSQEIEEPLMRIGDVAHQAEYLITALLVKDAPLWYVINRLTALNHNIQLIQTELKVITMKHQSMGCLKVEKYLSAELPLQDWRQAGVNQIIVGFEDKETDILDQLVGGGTWSLQLISIFGMPGLGKTTLANKLYNHPLVNYTFQKLSWCVVSQTFKRQSILANILIQINGDLDRDGILKMEEETLVEKIYKTLKGRRYLIVFDDVWDSNVWNKLQRCFPDDGNGSRILFTSRNKDVAPPNSIIHELPFLSADQCWELLEKKVFGSRTCPPMLRWIGMRIAAKCGGLPLRVVVVAGILSTADEEESKWEEVKGSLASYVDGEDNAVMQTLELSYNHLQNHLKPCFLYFGTFEEDREISVKKLMTSWVAEGFIRKEKEKSKEDIGREYLMELIDKSLVMVTKRSSDGRGVKACIVHDLLRDMCLRKCKEECLLNYMRRNCSTMYDKDQHLRSLYEESFGELYARDMRSLRALSYFYRGLRNGRVFGIEYLVNLRSLVVDGTWEYIDRLPKLEYLSSKFMGTLYLRPSILKTNKLRCLFATYLEYDEDCNGWETNSLESLSWITIKKLRDEELLKYSPRLRQLKCSYKLSSELAEYPHFDLRFLTQLHSLSLSFSGPWGGAFKLEDFRFPSYIKKLVLWGSRLSWEKISMIGRLENLEVLKLLKHSADGERWVTEDGEFLKLKFLKMDALLFSEWIVASNEHFPALQRLILIQCFRLNEIPREIGEVTTLELIEVKGYCGTSVVESAERIKEEQLDMGNEALRVVINTNRLPFD